MQTPTTHPSLAASFAQADTPPGAPEVVIMVRKHLNKPISTRVLNETWISLSDVHGNTDNYLRATLPGDKDWHPSHWHGWRVRIDQNGAKWECYMQTHVMDDFGFLVPVGGSA